VDPSYDIKRQLHGSVKEDSAGEFTMNKGYVTYQSDKLIMKKKGSKKVENEYGMPNKNFEIQFEFKTTQKNAALFSIEDGSDSSNLN
jgi:hypothetical protein